MGRRKGHRKHRQNSDVSQPSNSRGRGNSKHTWKTSLASPTPTQTGSVRFSRDVNTSGSRVVSDSIDAGTSATPQPVPAAKQKEASPAPSMVSASDSAVPAPKRMKLSIDITLSNCKYRIRIPLLDELNRVDATLELVHRPRDESERMQWEHCCPHVLYRCPNTECRGPVMNSKPVAVEPVEEIDTQEPDDLMEDAMDREVQDEAMDENVDTMETQDVAMEDDTETPEMTPPKGTMIATQWQAREVGETRVKSKTGLKREREE